MQHRPMLKLLLPLPNPYLNHRRYRRTADKTKSLYAVWSWRASAFLVRWIIKSCTTVPHRPGHQPLMIITVGPSLCSSLGRNSDGPPCHPAGFPDSTNPINSLYHVSQETSIIFPSAKVTFDIGRCPQRACFQQTVLLSHTHLDHVGGK